MAELRQSRRIPALCWGRSMAAYAFFLKKRLNVAPKGRLCRPPEWRLPLPTVRGEQRSPRAGAKLQENALIMNPPGEGRASLRSGEIMQRCQPIHSGRIAVPPGTASWS